MLYYSIVVHNYIAQCYIYFAIIAFRCNAYNFVTKSFQHNASRRASELNADNLLMTIFNINKLNKYIIYNLYCTNMKINIINYQTIRSITDYKRSYESAFSMHVCLALLASSP